MDISCTKGGSAKASQHQIDAIRGLYELYQGQQQQIDSLWTEFNALKHLMKEKDVSSELSQPLTDRRSTSTDGISTLQQCSSDGGLGVTVEELFSIRRVALNIQKFLSISDNISEFAAAAKQFTYVFRPLVCLIFFGDESQAHQASIYNVELDEWTKLTDVPETFEECNGAVISNNLYVHAAHWFYGYDPAGKYCAELQCLDLESLSWSHVSDCPSNCVDAVVAVGPRFYLIGSDAYDWNNGGASGKAQVTYVDHFRTDTWDWGAGVAHSPYRQCFCATAVLRDIYACGYLSEASRADVQRYDTAHNTWHVIPPMRQNLCPFSIAAVSHLLYVFGHLESDRLQIFCECFDTSLGTWTVLSGPLSLLGVRIQSMERVVACGGKVYVFGRGEAANDGCFGVSVCHRFIPESGTWEVVQSLMRNIQDDMDIVATR